MKKIIVCIWLYTIPFFINGAQAPAPVPVKPQVTTVPGQAQAPIQTTTIAKPAVQNPSGQSTVPGQTVVGQPVASVASTANIPNQPTVSTTAPAVNTIGQPAPSPVVASSNVTNTPTQQLPPNPVAPIVFPHQVGQPGVSTQVTPNQPQSSPPVFGPAPGAPATPPAQAGPPVMQGQTMPPQPFVGQAQPQNIPQAQAQQPKPKPKIIPPLASGILGPDTKQVRAAYTPEQKLLSDTLFRETMGKISEHSGNVTSKTMSELFGEVKKMFIDTAGKNQQFKNRTELDTALSKWQEMIAKHLTRRSTESQQEYEIRLKKLFDKDINVITDVTDAMSEALFNKSPDNQRIIKENIKTIMHALMGI